MRLKFIGCNIPTSKFVYNPTTVLIKRTSEYSFNLLYPLNFKMCKRVMSFFLAKSWNCIPTVALYTTKPGIEWNALI